MEIDGGKSGWVESGAPSAGEEGGDEEAAGADESVDGVAAAAAGLAVEEELPAGGVAGDAGAFCGAEDPVAGAGGREDTDERLLPSGFISWRVTSLGPGMALRMVQVPRPRRSGRAKAMGMTATRAPPR